MITATDYTETENRIFDAALHVFSLKGKDGARMQEIADRAGINKAMLHYYFRSKDRLYEAVFTYVIRQFTGSFGADVAAAPTFQDALRQLINGYMDFVSGNQAILRLMINEMLSSGPILAERLPELIRSGEDLPPMRFMNRLREAIESGEIRPVDPLQTLLSIVSCCIFFFIAVPIVRQVPTVPFDVDRFLQQRKEHVFDLIYTGLKSTPGPETA